MYEFVMLGFVLCVCVWSVVCRAVPPCLWRTPLLSSLTPACAVSTVSKLIPMCAQTTGTASQLFDSAAGCLGRT